MKFHCNRTSDCISKRLGRGLSRTFLRCTARPWSNSVTTMVSKIQNFTFRSFKNQSYCDFDSFQKIKSSKKKRAQPLSFFEPSAAQFGLFSQLEPFWAFFQHPWPCFGLFRSSSWATIIYIFFEVSKEAKKAEKSILLERTCNQNRVREDWTEPHHSYIWTREK